MKTLITTSLILAALIANLSAYQTANAGNLPNGQYHYNTCAETGAPHHGRGSFHDNRRDNLGPLYGGVSSCSQWEDARLEYNQSREVASIPVYVPERHLINIDNGLRPEERNSR